MRESGFVLRFPFGEVPVDRALVIGRQPEASPLAAKLSRYDKVSRRHAQLSIENGQMTVTDLDSTNHVYVNGKQVEKNAPTPICNGDEIAFSHQLRAILIKREN